MLASPVGAGFSAATGSAPPSAPASDGGAPGFAEQLQQATSGSETENRPAAHPAHGRTPVVRRVPQQISGILKTIASAGDDAAPPVPADAAGTADNPDGPAAAAPQRNHEKPGEKDGGKSGGKSEDDAPQSGATDPASIPGRNLNFPGIVAAAVPVAGGAPLAARTSVASRSAAPLRLAGASGATAAPVSIAPLGVDGPAAAADKLAFALRIRQAVEANPGDANVAGPHHTGTGNTPGTTLPSTAAPAPANASGSGGHAADEGNENSSQSQNQSASGAASARAASQKNEATHAAGGGNAIEAKAATPPSSAGAANAVNVAAPDARGAKAGPASVTKQEIARTEPDPILPEKPSVPVSGPKNISLRMEGPSGQMVDIRIAARSGDLDVAVHAGDDRTAQNLRQGLGELESRLAQNGYHSDTWHPGHSGPAAETAAPSRNASDSSSQQQSNQQSSHGWGGSRQNQGQRENQPQNRRGWVQELASTLRSATTEKGNTDGISS